MTAFTGAIFDLDGVITQTATVHFRAWKRTFDRFLETHATIDDENGQEPQIDPFTYEDDYLPYVDGKPRYDGVRSFLESRDIDLPYGDPSDEPGFATVCAVGNMKNEMFRRTVAEDGVDEFESSIRLIRAMRERGIRLGVASSSRNAGYILETTGLIELFGTVVDGNVSKELGLKGKPAPDIFETAAARLGLRPGECVMFEDAQSGVQAGRNGNFGYVVGVARGENPESLWISGADIVVRDLAEISLDDIDRWFREGMKEDSWLITWAGFDASKNAEKLRETLSTSANGYFGTRGAFEWAGIDDDLHYPGTYIAGIYNRLPTTIHGKTIYNNDLVNCPDWRTVHMRIGDDDFLRLEDVDLLSYRHRLDMRRGVTSRELLFRDRKGRITRIESSRFASMADRHRGALRYAVTPENYSERITLRSGIDGSVINYGVPRYRDLAGKHLDVPDCGERDGGIYLHARTTASGYQIRVGARNRLFAEDGSELAPERTVAGRDERVWEDLSFDAREGETAALEKAVGIHTSRQEEGGDPDAGMVRSLQPVRYGELLDAHEEAWERLWETAQVEIDGDRFAQKMIRLHTYHLLGTASPNTVGLDVGIPARGLTGEAYRGHIFWDELFMVPFFNLHFPDIVREALMYRYRRLDDARAYAREYGYAGAMYPWQTADTGGEESQVIHFNPVSGKWDPDLSRNQRHISISITYNIWEYYYITNDLAFLHDYGMEMMIEIARFWVSKAKIDERDGRYHIDGVMGPDEFHEKYPDAREGGFRDNAYTNIMAAWLIHKTVEMVEHMPEEVLRRLERTIGFRAEEVKGWDDLVARMTVEMDESGILSQFQGFRDLRDLDLEAYRKKYGDIHRMDRILKAEGDSPDRYTVIKQADALMIFYLLSPGQVCHILDMMGYTVGDDLEFLKRNYEYYVSRTCHGSTLSYVVHSAILKYLPGHDREQWGWYRTALRSDIHDIQGGTTAEAIHCGVQGGTLDVLWKAFAGINIFRDFIAMEPSLPEHWSRLAFTIVHRGNRFAFDIDPAAITVRRFRESKEDIFLQVNDRKIVFSGKESERRISYRRKASTIATTRGIRR